MFEHVLGCEGLLLVGFLLCSFMLLLVVWSNTMIPSKGRSVGTPSFNHGEKSGKENR